MLKKSKPSGRKKLLAILIANLLPASAMSRRRRQAARRFSPFCNRSKPNQ